MDGIPSIAPILIEPASEPAEHRAPHDRRKSKGTKPAAPPEASEASTPEAGDAEPADGDAHLLDLDA